MAKLIQQFHPQQQGFTVLAANLVHELRNSLLIIKSAVRHIEQISADNSSTTGDTASLAGLISGCQGELSHANHCLNRFIDNLIPDQVYSIDDYQTIDLRVILAAVIAGYSANRRYRNKKIIYLDTVAPGAITLQVDETKITKALYYLLDNLLMLLDSSKSLKIQLGERCQKLTLSMTTFHNAAIKTEQDIYAQFPDLKESEFGEGMHYFKCFCQQYHIDMTTDINDRSLEIVLYLDIVRCENAE